MDSFTGKLAVVTGGGSGMGRELVRQLAAQGCSVAACDINAQSVKETAALARAAADERVVVTSHACDVADEAQVLRFRDELVKAHDTDHVDLVFSNAGIGGAGSFVCDKREDWERTFAIDFWGTYYCARAFLPLLIASGDGILVNTSSVNGFWATLGPGMPNTAYSTAKFAVKGFTEALIEDLRTNAPQVTVAVVLAGHVGTDILRNSRRILGYAGPEQMSEAELEEARTALARLGLPVQDASLDELRETVVKLESQFKDSAPLSAATAATIILDGVRAGEWRILVGEDAKGVDRAVRAQPEAAYDYAELAKAAARTAAGQARRVAGHPGLAPRSVSQLTSAWRIVSAWPATSTGRESAVARRGVDVGAPVEQVLGHPPLATVAGLPERLVQVLLARGGIGLEELVHPGLVTERRRLPQAADAGAPRDQQPGHLPAAVGHGVDQRWPRDGPGAWRFDVGPAVDQRDGHRHVVAARRPVQRGLRLGLAGCPGSAGPPLGSAPASMSSRAISGPRGK